MILRPVSPASPIGPPMTKRPVGLMWIFGFCVEHVGGNDGLDHMLHDRRGANLRSETVSLCCVEMTTQSTRNRFAVAIFDGDLGFSIGTEEIDFLALADFREALRQAVGQLDRHGHQFFGFVAGKAEHQALVARAAGVHAHGDVRRLALDGAHDRAGVGIKTDRARCRSRPAGRSCESVRRNRRARWW